jgi:hypothetical protein
MACPHTPPPDAASRPGVRLVGDEYFTAIAQKRAEEEHAVDSAPHSSVETPQQIVKKEKERVQRSAPAPKDSEAEAPKDEASKAPSINEKEENTRKFTLSGPEFHEMTSLRERLSAQKTVKSPHASPVAETREDAATSKSEAGASPHLDGKPSALQHDWSGFENYEADDDDHAFEVAIWHILTHNGILLWLRVSALQRKRKKTHAHTHTHTHTHAHKQIINIIKESQTAELHICRFWQKAFFKSLYAAAASYFSLVFVCGGERERARAI